MQIIVDISEEEYTSIKKHPHWHSLGDLIAQGTPLPKGHGRLIDADKLEVGPVFDEYGNRDGYRYVTKYELDNAPTIIKADNEVEE